VSAEERKQAGWVGAPCEAGDGYASCYFAGGSCVQCGRAAGAGVGLLTDDGRTRHGANGAHERDDEAKPQ